METKKDKQVTENQTDQQNQGSQSNQPNQRKSDAIPQKEPAEIPGEIKDIKHPHDFTGQRENIERKETIDQSSKAGHTENMNRIITAAKILSRKVNFQNQYTKLAF